jgi:hypothetical protein
MRNLLGLLLLGGLFLTHLSADSVQYNLVSFGGGAYQYQYTFNGAFSSPYEVVDLVFDSSYTSVTSPVATPSNDWFTFILQGVPGGPHDYIAEALIANPPLNGTFSVNFTYAAQSPDPTIPGSQQFMFDQFDSNGNFVSQLSSGLTTQQSITDPVVPEPSSFALSGMLLAILMCFAVRRKTHPATSPRA